MIKSWEELGEVLAEFENRIGTLENSQTTNPTEKQESSEVIHRHFHSDLSKKQWDGIEQAILNFGNLDKKVNELYEKKHGTTYSIE